MAIAYRTAHLTAADGQSDMDAGRISVRIVGSVEIATVSTLRALRREQRASRVDFSGMTLSWSSPDGRLQSQEI
jgi:hypothetical protein